VSFKGAAFDIADYISRYSSIAPQENAAFCNTGAFPEASETSKPAKSESSLIVVG